MNDSSAHGSHFKKGPSVSSQKRGRVQPNLSAIPQFERNDTWTDGEVSMGAHSGHRHHHHRSHKRRALRVVAVIGVIVLALLIAVGVVGYRFYNSAMTIRTQATELVTQTSDLSSQIMSGDSTSAGKTAASIASTAKSMHEETSSPLWNAATHLPVYGGDVVRIQTLTYVADDLSSNAIVPVTEMLSETPVSTMIGADGTINVDACTSLLNALASIQSVTHRSATALDGMGAATIPQIDEQIDKITPIIDQLDSVSNMATMVAPSVPTLLGANGQTKRYLFVAQGNSEIRATGGFPGAMTLLTITDGKMDLGNFTGVDTKQNNLAYFSPDEGFPLNEDERQFFDGGPTCDIPGDVGFMPDFTRVSTCWKWMWETRNSTSIDGVIAVDPVMLQSLLALTGSVTTSDGTVLDGTNAAQILLNGIYVKNGDVNDALSNAFFTETAGLCFNKVLSSLNTVNLTDLYKVLQVNAKEHRLLMWSTDETCESTFEQLGVSGGIETDTAHPVLGVYLSNKTYGKIDWYLNYATNVGQATLNADGTVSYPVTSTLTNTLTTDEAKTLMHMVLGAAETGDMTTVVNLVAPAGGTISNVSATGAPISPFAESTYESHDMWTSTLHITCGETVTVTYTVTTANNASVADGLTVRSTPTCHE